mgnify:CR=1 FL=1
MGKTIYQGKTKQFTSFTGKPQGLQEQKASDKMEAVSDSKIEKFEYETQEPTPLRISFKWQMTRV